MLSSRSVKCSSDAARRSSDTARSLLLLQHAPPSSLPSTRADDSHYATAAAQSAPGRPIFLGPTDLAEAATAVRSCSMYWLARSAASQPQWVGGGHRAWRLGRLGLADLSMVAPARSDE